MFEEIYGVLILSIVVVLFIAILLMAHMKSLTTPGDKCISCGRQLQPDEESTLITKNVQGIQVQKRLCKGCMQESIDEQGGICPYCKEPIRWKEALREFMGKWYHPECFLGLQHGKATVTREVSKEVIIKVRCTYCGQTYDESLDECPHCGAKHA